MGPDDLTRVCVRLEMALSAMEAQLRDALVRLAELEGDPNEPDGEPDGNGARRPKTVPQDRP